MIKFHRPDFLIAPLTLDAPPPKRNLLQKIFHKKKDDLLPAERRAIQISADRSSRTKLFGGLITISHTKKDDLSPAEHRTAQRYAKRLRELADRMRELDAKQEENDQANEAKRISDMQSIEESNDEEATDPSDAASIAESHRRIALGDYNPDDDIPEAEQSDENRSVADTQQSSKRKRVKIATPVEILAQTARRYMPEAEKYLAETDVSTDSPLFSRTVQALAIKQAVHDEDDKNGMYGDGWKKTLGEQGEERNRVANEIVNVFSAAAEKGIDLSKALKSDEIDYLTRAMGLANKPKSLRVAGYDEVEKDDKGNITRYGTYTGSFDPLKNLRRQTAGLLLPSQVEKRLLTPINGSAITLDESTRDLGKQPPISARSLLENVEKVLSTLRGIDPEELSRLRKQPDEQGDLAKSQILASLDNLEASIRGLQTGTQKALNSQESGSLPATDKRQLMQAESLLGHIQKRVEFLKNEITPFDVQRLLDRLIDMEKKLNESIDDLKSLQPNSAAMVRERTEEISRALRNIDKSEVSRLCDRSGAKGEKAKSDIARQFGRIKAKADDLHNVIIIKTDYWSQTSGFKDEDIRQLKRATKLLRGDISSTIWLDERGGDSKAGSARPVTLKDLLLADSVTKEEEIHVDARPNVSSEDNLSATSKQESIELFFDAEGELRVLESVANSESAHGGNSAIPKWETDVLEALKKFTPATDKWLQDNNYAVATNHGTGMNCLLISLLQHAMRNYDDEHEQLAQQIRAKLEEKHGDIEPGGMLSVFPGNDSIFQAAVAIINYELDAGLDPILVFPAEDGHPTKGRDDDKIEIGSRKNLIVYGRNGSLHFEALRRNDSTIQNRNDGHETNTLALPVDGSAANKKALERKSVLARVRAMVHIKGKSEDSSIRNMDRPLKGDNLERFKERMDECVASVRTAQSWQEKAAGVKDIQQHLQGAERKLAELNRGEAQELAKVLGKLLQNIEGQQKIQSRLSAEEESRTLREQTVSALGKVAYQLKGVITKVDPLKFLEFSETQFREKISIAAPGKSWEVKHRDILDVKRALNGLWPEIGRLAIAPTSLANTARKLEVASLLDSLQMQIHEEQEQMQRPKSKNSTEAQVKTLQAEVAKQLEQYIRKCYPLDLFRERVGAPDGALAFVPALKSFEDIVREYLHPTDDGPGDDPKRIRHLNYLQSKLAELDSVDLWDLIDKEVEVLAERIDWLREDVDERCEEIENRLASQNSEDTQAVDDMKEELGALDGVADELDRLLGLCRPSSTPEPVATQGEAGSESEDDYGTASASPLDQRLTRSV